MTTPAELRQVAEHFCIDGEFLSAVSHGSGHINDTYLTEFTDNGSLGHYIVQRINHHVFKNPGMMMDNIVRVTDHLHCKLAARFSVDELSRRVLSVIPTREGQALWRDPAGSFWRAYQNIKSARTYDQLESTEQAFQAARAFGMFLRDLADLPGPPLGETISDFHNGPVRYRGFLDALEADRVNRAASCKPEIDFLKDHAWIFDVIPALVEQKRIPLRTTHNDTKINNVLLDNGNGEGICVIDLDTVMPGVSLFDFGDMVRSSISSSAEDESDLSKVDILMPVYEALLRGYLDSGGELLNRTEKEHLAFGGKMMSLIIGARFLTDYLDGDRYYRTHCKHHNLDRCRTQFRLVDCITAREDEMNTLMEKV